MNIISTLLDMVKKIWECFITNLSDIESIATTASVLIALITYMRSVKRARVEKATQISEIFAKYISQQAGVIIHLFNAMFDNTKLKTSHTNVKDYMFEKVNNKAELFDENEYKNIFNDDERNIIDHWFNFDNLTEEYIAKYEIKKSSSLEERTQRFDFLTKNTKRKTLGLRQLREIVLPLS